MSLRIVTFYRHTTNTNAVGDLSILSSPEDIVKHFRASLACPDCWEGPITVHLYQQQRIPPSGSSKFRRLSRPLVTLVLRGRESSAFEESRDPFKDINCQMQRTERPPQGLTRYVTTGSKSRAILTVTVPRLSPTLQTPIGSTTVGLAPKIKAEVKLYQQFHQYFQCQVVELLAPE